MGEPISIKLFWVGYMNKQGLVTKVTDGPFTDYYKAADEIAKHKWSADRYIVLTSAEQLRKMTLDEIKVEEGIVVKPKEERK